MNGIETSKVHLISSFLEKYNNDFVEIGHLRQNLTQFHLGYAVHNIKEQTKTDFTCSQSGSSTIRDFQQTVYIESDAKKTGKMFCNRMILLSILDSQTYNITLST